MLNRVLRRALMICLGIAGIFAAVVLYLVLSQKVETLQRAVSPDGKYIAEWREYNQSSATSSNLDTVELRSRSSPFRRMVLTGSWAFKPSIVWIDARNLLVECGGCGNFAVKCDTCKEQEFYVISKETQWRDVTIHYGKE